MNDRTRRATTAASGPDVARDTAVGRRRADRDRQPAWVRWGTSAVPFTEAERIRARLDGKGPDDRLIVAIVGETVVGDAGLHRRRGRRSHCAELGISVHDDWTGRGIGNALMAALVDLADNWIGLRRLELTVNADNHRAQALYRRFNFELEGTHRCYILRDGLYVDALTMARISPCLISAAPGSSSDS